MNDSPNNSDQKPSQPFTDSDKPVKDLLASISEHNIASATQTSTANASTGAWDRLREWIIPALLSLIAGFGIFAAYELNRLNREIGSISTKLDSELNSIDVQLDDINDDVSSLDNLLEKTRDATGELGLTIARAQSSTAELARVSEGFAVMAATAAPTAATTTLHIPIRDFVSINRANNTLTVRYPIDSAIEPTHEYAVETEVLYYNLIERPLDGAWLRERIEARELILTIEHKILRAEQLMKLLQDMKNPPILKVKISGV